MHENEGFAQLVDGLVRYEARDTTGARALWLEASACGPVPALIGRTLVANLDGTLRRAHPYEPDPDRTEHRQIDLFEQIRKLEFVHVAQQLVINAHAETPLGTTLLDLGIGRGESAAEIVAASRGNIARVVGVDIDPASIAASEEEIGGLGVEFVGVVDDLATLDWDALAAHLGPIVAVNASFSLRHLDLAAKTRVLSAVAALTPVRVTLVEPSSSHASADMLDRLIGAYAHYTALWAAITASEVRRDAQRSVLRFLGREIGDIMRDDPVRYQRDEHWEFWYRQLLRAGLRPVAFAATQLDPEVVQLLPGAANVHARNTHLLTTFSFAAR